MREAVDETIRLTADVVLFAYDENGEKHVLLIQRRWDPFAGSWALPGGHVDPGERTTDAAFRELAEEAGVEADYLVHVGAYATPERDPRGRYVTFAYTLTLSELISLTAADDAAEARWWPLDEVTPQMLAFDHYQILSDAHGLAQDES